MNKIELSTFIEEMEQIGDIWTEEQVIRCYANLTLEEALEKRRNELGQFFNGLASVISNIED